MHVLPQTQSVLEFRSLREQLYLSYISRASEGPNSNTPVIEQTLAVRLESAKLLGYSNFAEFSMASKVFAASSVPYSGLKQLYILCIYVHQTKH